MWLRAGMVIAALGLLACGEATDPNAGNSDAGIDAAIFDGGTTVDAPPNTEDAAVYDAPPTPPPDATPIAHTMFVSSTTTSPAIGIGGLDGFCQGLADIQTLGGTWRAVLYIAGQPPSSRITIDGPVQNILGQIIAADSASFFSGNASAPVAIDETGDAPADSVVWLGDSQGNDCKTWTAETTYLGGQAVSTNQSSWLTAVSTAACTLSRSVYCVSQ